MAARRIRDYGDHALLVECEDTDEVLAVSAAVRRTALPGVADVVPAARTVLVTFDQADRQQSARNALRDLEITPAAGSPTASEADVTLGVVYDGPDLAEVARLTGMTETQVVEAHTARPWRVAFVGFAPGFAYLVGGDDTLRVPRRAEPRTRVPAGAVGLAAEFSGVYPRETPGGWQLIGRTDASVWDPFRPRPALLQPGMWVRFRVVAS